MNETTLQVGGTGGAPFGPIEIPSGAKVSAVTVYSGDYVDGIEITCKASRKKVELPLIGGTGGSPETFTLAVGEVITGISGSAGDYIDAIQFHTNKGSSEVFGGGGGEPFSIELGKGEEFGGFVGRAEWFIDALAIVTVSAKAKKAAPKKVAPKAAAKAAPKAKSSAKPKKAVKAPAKPKATKTPKIVALPDPDDLKKIHGIGPKIEGLMHAAGIFTFAELGKATLKALRAVLDEAGPRFRLADPKEWREEAKKFAAAKRKGTKAA